MAAAFIASITVSAITARLTSYLGSIVIVGLSSVLLAVFNALYERFFKASKKAAAKAILHVPHSEALPETIAEKLHDAADDTGVIGVPDDGNKDGSGPDSEIEDGSTEESADDGDNPGSSAVGTPDDGDDDSRHGSLWDSIWHGVTHPNHVTKVIAAMAVMAIMTSLISWGVATFVEKPDVTNVTVRESKVEKLSDSEKNAIKQAAAAEVSNQIRQAQKAADAANGTAGSLNDRVSALESKLKTMQDSVDSLSRNPSQNQQESSDISAMRQQISQMRQEIDQLKTQNQELSSPSPSQSNRSGSGGTMGNSSN